MAGLTPEEKKSLLKLARTAITSCLASEKSLRSAKPSSGVLAEKRGCFVSLHRRGQLRGCIGTLEPSNSLWEGIEENAKNAAFCDPRFQPLEKAELEDTVIEISILTEPRPLIFEDSEDLKRRLTPGVHGVILSRGRQRATFLPQVWEQLPDKERFLEHLCRKAGLGPDCWKTEGITVLVYEVEHFSE